MIYPRAGRGRGKARAALWGGPPGVHSRACVCGSSPRSRAGDGPGGAGACLLARAGAGLRWGPGYVGRGCPVRYPLFAADGPGRLGNLEGWRTGKRRVPTADRCRPRALAVPFQAPCAHPAYSLRRNGAPLGSDRHKASHAGRLRHGHTGSRACAGPAHGTRAGTRRAARPGLGCQPASRGPCRKSKGPANLTPSLPDCHRARTPRRLPGTLGAASGHKQLGPRPSSPCPSRVSAPAAPASVRGRGRAVASAGRRLAPGGPLCRRRAQSGEGEAAPRRRPWGPGRAPFLPGVRNGLRFAKSHSAGEHGASKKGSGAFVPLPPS
jgi:hypothetical protein